MFNVISLIDPGEEIGLGNVFVTHEELTAPPGAGPGVDFIYQTLQGVEVLILPPLANIPAGEGIRYFIQNTDGSTTYYTIEHADPTQTFSYTFSLNGTEQLFWRRYYWTDPNDQSLHWQDEITDSSMGELSTASENFTP